MAMALPTPYSPSSPLRIILFTRKTMVRYRKKMVSAEHSALMALTMMAAWAPSENMVKNLANSWNTGFPGGCPTSSLYDDAINSPQSQ